MPEVPNNREGSQGREHSRCMRVELQRKTSQRGLLIASYKRLEKTLLGPNSCRGGSLCPCTLGATRGPATKQLRHLHAHLSLGQSCRSKKSLVSMHAGSLRSCLTLCDPVDCGLPGFSGRGDLQTRILKCIGQYCLPYASRALYFLQP